MKSKHVRHPRRAGYCDFDGFKLEIGIDHLGRTVSKCTACERRRAGRCMDCGGSVVGKAWRCPRHLKAANAKAIRASAIRNREAHNARVMEKYHADEAFRRRMNQRNSEYRKANRERVCLYKRMMRRLKRAGVAPSIRRWA